MYALCIYVVRARWLADPGGRGAGSGEEAGRDRRQPADWRCGLAARTGGADWRRGLAMVKTEATVAQDYLANLLGAASLGISDRVTAAADASLGLGGQTAAALVLVGMSPRTSIKKLAERLRLSHPGAVRLAERLESEGLVARHPAEDRREVRLALTRKG